MFVHEQDHGDFRIYAAAIERASGGFTSAVAVQRIRGTNTPPVAALRNDFVGEHEWENGALALRAAVEWALQALEPYVANEPRRSPSTSIRSEVDEGLIRPHDRPLTLPNGPGR